MKRIAEPLFVSMLALALSACSTEVTSKDDPNIGESQQATAPVDLVNVPLARGTNTSHGTLPLQFGTDVAMAQITVQVGGSSGWHSHPGGAIVVVKQGSLTVYRSLGSQCQIETYSAGQAFLEQPGEVDQVVNTGNAPYELFVTFPRVPQGESPRTDEPNAGTCPSAPN